MKPSAIYPVVTFLFIVGCLTVTKSFSQQRKVITPTDTFIVDVVPDAEEYRILSEFFKETKGKGWRNSSNWLHGKTSADFATWYGIVVRNGDISEIHLDGNNLDGTVPSTVYKLHGLRSLTLDGNPKIEEQVRGTRIEAASSVSLMSARTAAPIKAGLNLPVWALAVTGNKFQKVDWRIDPAEVSELSNSGKSMIGPSGVAVNVCGDLAFYVLHSGVDKKYQLNIFDATGVQLTNSKEGDMLCALNSAISNIELQVVRVPQTADEWFVIYSLHSTCPPLSSAYCYAKVAYARVKYNPAINPTFQILERDIVISSSTFIQGKAVSRTKDGGAGHYLYLADRTQNSNSMRIHRFTIDQIGIHTEQVSASEFSAQYWNGGISGSSVELSPDEALLAVSNRNVGTWIKEDIILFDLTSFADSEYNPKIISIPNLIVAGTGKTVRQIAAANSSLCLHNMKNKIGPIEFSPSGQYLYALHGGYPEGSSSVPYNTYLLQIDLWSAAEGKTDYDLRMKIELGEGVDDFCTGTPGSAHYEDFLMYIQTSFDGQLYFTKTQRNKIFVLPNPDVAFADGIPEAVDGLDLSQPGSANVSMINRALVLLLPENIDGYNYIEQNLQNAFTFDRTTIFRGEQIQLTVSAPEVGNVYQLSWGDGTRETVHVESSAPIVISHQYDAKGIFPITITLINPQGCTKSSTVQLTVKDCAFTQNPASPLAISHQQLRCAVKFSFPKIQDCYTTYLWDFGDGTTSTERAPIHVYGSPGVEKVVSLTVRYECEICTEELPPYTYTFTPGAPPPLEEITHVIEIPTDVREEIITTAATSFSDSWLLDHNDKRLEKLNPFASGETGVWRVEGQFAYITERESGVNKAAPAPSAQVNLRKDGTFDQNHFNWKYSDLEGVEKWTKAATLTKYNAYGNELENKDILNIYSASLYDHKGQFQTAIGSNTRQDEFGFTSFESIEGELTQDPVPSGNFVFKTGTVPLFKSLKAASAEGHIAIVRAALADIEHALTADISARPVNDVSAFAFSKTSKYLKDVRIVCKEAHPTLPGTSILVFAEAPFDDVWTGSIRIKSKIVSVNGEFSSEFAHTGISSLKIVTPQSFEQRIFRLDGGKTYDINAWVFAPVTIAVPDPSGYGIEIVLKNADGKTISSTFLLPDARKIESWQQVKGSFVAPVDDLTLTLKFRPGSGAKAFFDDIRLHPHNGNMKSFVYDLKNLRLSAILDENNFSSRFYYDKQGRLYLTKKETEEGTKTVQESITHQAIYPTDN
jgi:hypothetical protein